MKVLLLLALVVPVAVSWKCESCDSTQGNCNSNECTGDWCTVTILENKATGAKSLSKSCAPSNPTNAKEDGCVKNAQPDGNENIQCACRGDGCNSEGGIARLLAMLNNPHFGGPGPVGGAPFPQNPNPSLPNGQQPPPPPGSFAPNGQPFVPPNFVNPNSTLPDVLSGQPTPFGGAPQPVPGNGQFQPGQPLPPNQPIAPNQPNPGQAFPGNNGQNPSFPQPQPGVPNQPQFPPAGNPGVNQPVPVSPRGPNVPPDTNGNGLGGPGSVPTNRNGVIDPANNNSVNGSPVNGNSITGSARSNPVTSSGSMTCACTEPDCNGPCKGEVCYLMTFAASDVHSQSFSSKQGTIVQAGCTDDQTVLSNGATHVTVQVPNYKFKSNGEDVMVPARATYCKDNNYCNGAANMLFRFSTLFTALAVITLVFRPF